MTATTPRVDFWFDPVCPWAWMTSRWLDDVARQRGFEPTWHVMSLAILNEGRDLPAQYMERMAHAKRLVRFVNGVIQTQGESFTKPLYDALGEQIHPGGRSDYDAIMLDVLGQLQLDPSLAELADSDRYDESLHESHRSGITLVGEDVGTPIIAVDGVAFFGPVISPAPSGQAALDLWDGVVAVAAYPGFFEIKRTRTVGPQF